MTHAQDPTVLAAIGRAVQLREADLDRDTQAQDDQGPEHPDVLAQDNLVPNILDPDILAPDVPVQYGLAPGIQALVQAVIHVHRADLAVVAHRKAALTEVDQQHLTSHDLEVAAPNLRHGRGAGVQLLHPLRSANGPYYPTQALMLSQDRNSKNPV